MRHVAVGDVRLPGLAHECAPWALLARWTASTKESPPNVAEAGEAAAVVHELVPAAESVAVEQSLVGKELLGGEELGDDALGVVVDAPSDREAGEGRGKAPPLIMLQFSPAPCPQVDDGVQAG
jgi:hypothetical protein